MPKRTRDDSHGRRRDLIPAVDVIELRAALGISQTDFAAQLGVSRRTVIRGESRGIEIPWRNDSTRAGVRDRWQSLKALSQKRPSTGKA